MKRLRLITVLGVLVGGIMSSYAQDPTFSQYFAAPMYLNPALTGFEGGINIQLNHRDQWVWVGEKPTKFYTESFAVDAELDCIKSAIGFTYMHNEEGIGRYRWHVAGLSYAFKINGSNKFGDTELSLGLRVSYNRRSLNWSRFIFSDQLDPVHGRVRDSDIAFPDDGMNINQFMDLDFGVSYFQEIDQQHSFVIGAAIAHLAHINSSIQDINDTLPLRSTLHLAYTHELRSFPAYVYISPTLKIETQRSTSSLFDMRRFGRSVQDYFTGFFYRSVLFGSGFDIQASTGVWGGLWFHRRGYKNAHTNAVILMAGIAPGRYTGAGQSGNRFRIGLSYDVPISGLRSDSGGTWEISLSMNFADVSLFNCKCLIPPFSRPKFR